MTASLLAVGNQQHTHVSPFAYTRNSIFPSFWNRTREMRGGNIPVRETKEFRKSARPENR